MNKLREEEGKMNKNRLKMLEKKEGREQEAKMRKIRLKFTEKKIRPLRERGKKLSNGRIFTQKNINNPSEPGT